MTRRVVLSLFILAAVLVAFSGCISPQFTESSPSYTWTDEVAVQEAYDGGYAPSVAYSKTANAGYDTADQMIVQKSSIELEVQDVPAALDSIKSIATVHGGYIGSMSVNTRSGDRLYGLATIRVPASSFDPVIEEIKKIGTVKSQSLQADDVTEEYIDLQARRDALSGQLVQYQRIMEKAENVSEILEVQQAIERVQVELDRIDGRLKYLDNRVDYATITVSVHEPEGVGTGGGFSITSVINDGIAGLLAVTAGIVIVVISLVPFIILAGIAYLVYRVWKRRKAKDT
ncbi:MAG: hypothetical protein APR55_06705 [Methanolinea sp. SDB]|nr:MAG: hypothetical protein APR55_06705 [Methanolinea sp. SDB]